MRLAFNAQLVGRYNSGVETYINCLLDQFDSRGPADGFEIDVFVRNGTDGGPPRWRGLGVRPVGVVAQSRLLRICWEQFVLPRVVRGKYDLLHAPGYVGPLFGRVPTVLTVHDIIALRHPALCSRANALHYGLLLPASVRKAARIIVPSRWVRAQLLRHFDLAARKVEVIYEGVRDLFRRPPAAAASLRLRAAHNLSGRVVLFVGNIEPKKNLPRLLYAFDRLRGRYADLKLVLCGRVRWRSDQFYEALKRSRYGDDVVLTGYLPDEELNALYRLAEVFVFPSLSEGFGVPPLEAMACGTPVVASHGEALGETLGGAAVTFDPRDAAALGAALDRVLGSRGQRQELREKGLIRSRQFTWEAAAEQTLNLYENALSHPA